MNSEIVRIYLFGYTFACLVHVCCFVRIAIDHVLVVTYIQYNIAAYGIASRAHVSCLDASCYVIRRYLQRRSTTSLYFDSLIG